MGHVSPHLWGCLPVYPLMTFPLPHRDGLVALAQDPANVLTLHRNGDLSHVTGGFHSQGGTQNRWFIRGNPILIRMIWGDPYLGKPHIDDDKSIELSLQLLSYY